MAAWHECRLVNVIHANGAALVSIGNFLIIRLLQITKRYILLIITLASSLPT